MAESKEETLFNNKYRIKSARYDGWDYSRAGFYFITICIKDKRSLFGKIKDENVILSPIGEIVKNFWLEIPKHFQNAILDEFIIMPNHLHGIVEINYENKKISRDEAMPRLYAGECGNKKNEAMPRLYIGDYPEMSKISPKSGSLPAVIGAFKSISTKMIRRKFTQINFNWQSRFYDRIIRDEKEWNNIRQYIIDNPLKWLTDKENMGNLYR